MTITKATPIDQDKLNQFLGRFVDDLGAVFSAPLVVIGDQLGLYRGLSDGGPQTSSELAARTGCAERYVREWLANQAAGGYVSYDPAGERFFLSPEQAFCLADPASPAYLPGGVQLALSTTNDREKVAARFRTGDAMGWHEHHHDLFEGTERFLRPGYAGNLVPSWLPALDGVVAKLTAGARVADVGCGLGASTLIMAAAFPASSFVGFDYHEASIEGARERAAEAGLAERVTFEIDGAQDYPGSGYDLVTFFDCLHDMGDPVDAARHVRQSLAPDGTWMVVEPYAGATLAENLNPVGRVFYGASTTICTPAGLTDDGLALGNQVPDATWENLLRGAGWSSFRRVATTPFNRVFELRP
ncbi:MAG: class I SAM-dependent methyltransferase [Acidimicrobiales bacterium]